MSIWRFIILLPTLIESLVKLQKVIKDYDLKKWLEELNVAIKKAEEAKDAQSRREAAIAIADVISKL